MYFCDCLSITEEAQDRPALPFSDGEREVTCVLVQFVHYLKAP